MYYRHFYAKTRAQKIFKKFAPKDSIGLDRLATRHIVKLMVLIGLWCLRFLIFRLCKVVQIGHDLKVRERRPDARRIRTPQIVRREASECVPLRSSSSTVCRASDVIDE